MTLEGHGNDFPAAVAPRPPRDKQLITVTPKSSRQMNKPQNFKGVGRSSRKLSTDPLQVLTASMVMWGETPVCILNPRNILKNQWQSEGRTPNYEQWATPLKDRTLEQWPSHGQVAPLQPLPPRMMTRPPQPGHLRPIAPDLPPAPAACLEGRLFSLFLE